MKKLSNNLVYFKRLMHDFGFRMKLKSGINEWLI